MFFPLGTWGIGICDLWFIIAVVSFDKYGHFLLFFCDDPEIFIMILVQLKVEMLAIIKLSIFFKTSKPK